MEQSYADGAVAGAIIMVALGVLVVFLIPLIFYLLTLQKALNRCSPENRAMAPGLVWVMLIPVFGFIWHFIMVLNVAKSLGAEFQKRGITEDPKPGQQLGIVMCVLSCCSIIPLLNMLSSPAFLICWIIYWVKIAGYSAKLASPAPLPA